MHRLLVLLWPLNSNHTDSQHTFLKLFLQHYVMLKQEASQNVHKYLCIRNRQHSFTFNQAFSSESLTRNYLMIIQK